MLILVNTDHNVLGQEGLASRVEQDVTSILKRFADYVTRVEVHLSDDLSGKHKSPGKKCVMEARLAGRAPLAVDHHGDSVKKSYDGAACNSFRCNRPPNAVRPTSAQMTRGVVAEEI